MQSGIQMIGQRQSLQLQAKNIEVMPSKMDLVWGKLGSPVKPN